MVLLKAQDELQWFVNTGFCLILIHYGRSPLVHLLIQSSHWVTAMAHYYLNTKQFFAWSRFSLRSCLFSTKAHTARQWLLLCKIKSSSFKPYQRWDLRHKKNEKGNRKAVILKRHVNACSKFYGKPPNRWEISINNTQVISKSLGCILIHKAAQQGCNDWIIIKINWKWHFA